MLKRDTRYILCWWYDKDIWGNVITKHKRVNFARIKLYPNKTLLPKFNKKRRPFENLTWKLAAKNIWFINFSFEIIRWSKKKRKKKLKNWMRFLFLVKSLWIVYGNITKKKFTYFCKLCLSKKKNAFFYFILNLEFRLPMFIYRSGFSPSLSCATQWVKSGFISINGLKCMNNQKVIKLHDFITFNIKTWDEIIKHLTRIFFYSTAATQVYKCRSYAYHDFNKLKPWAHFLALPNYVYCDIWNFSLYWWNLPEPTKFKYYFPLNITNLLKYVTI